MRWRISSKLHTEQNTGRSDSMQEFLIQKREFRTVTRRFTVRAETKEDAIEMVRLGQVGEDSSTEDDQVDEFTALKG